MIAKLIAHASTRDAALGRLAHALDGTLLAGPRSNVAFLAALCRASEFRQGGVDTGFIDRNLAVLGAVPHGIDRAAAAVGVARLLSGNLMSDLSGGAAQRDDDDSDADSPWAARDGFQLGGARSLAVPVLIDGESTLASVAYDKDGVRVAFDETGPATDAQVFVAQEEAYVLRHGRQTRVRIQDFSTPAAAAGVADGVIKAPMHGRVLEILVGLDDDVAAGQRLAVIEAMKMEHTLLAPFAGKVMQVPIAAGAQVVEGAEIMVIEPFGKR
jgi:3-methylcrotonyl-CoA carboxylase alpha subunit